MSPFLPGVSETSERTQETVDAEVRRIVETAERETLELLQRERDRLDALARALLERETLDQEEAYEAAGVPMPERAPDIQPRTPAAERAARRRRAGRRRRAEPASGDSGEPDEIPATAGS